MYIYDNLGRKIKFKHVNAVDALFKLKQKNGSNPWPVIEKCFQVWEAEYPQKYDSYLVYLKDMRETRKNEFAVTKDKETGGYLRYTIDLPQPVMMMIRCLYNANELPMNREFFKEFARRFPRYRVAQKL